MRSVILAASVCAASAIGYYFSAPVLDATVESAVDSTPVIKEAHATVAKVESAQQPHAQEAVPTLWPISTKSEARRSAPGRDDLQ